MTDKIKQQILAIRDTGETNMFDVRKVQEIALREGYDDCFFTLQITLAPTAVSF